MKLEINLPGTDDAEALMLARQILMGLDRSIARAIRMRDAVDRKRTWTPAVKAMTFAEYERERLSLSAVRLAFALALQARELTNEPATIAHQG